jgi:hypothetical protein
VSIGKHFPISLSEGYDGWRTKTPEGPEDEDEDTHEPAAENLPEREQHAAAGSDAAVY